MTTRYSKKKKRKLKRLKTNIKQSLIDTRAHAHTGSHRLTEKKHLCI